MTECTSNKNQSLRRIITAGFFIFKLMFIGARSEPEQFLLLSLKLGISDDAFITQLTEFL
jgi:hypothetical protein